MLVTLKKFLCQRNICLKLDRILRIYEYILTLFLSKIVVFKQNVDVSFWICTGVLKKYAFCVLNGYFGAWNYMKKTGYIGIVENISGVAISNVYIHKHTKYIANSRSATSTHDNLCNILNAPQWWIRKLLCGSNPCYFSISMSYFP